MKPVSATNNPLFTDTPAVSEFRSHLRSVAQKCPRIGNVKSLECHTRVSITFPFQNGTRQVLTLWILLQICCALHHFKKKAIRRVLCTFDLSRVTVICLFSDQIQLTVYKQYNWVTDSTMPHADCNCTVATFWALLWIWLTMDKRIKIWQETRDMFVEEKICIHVQDTNPGFWMPFLHRTWTWRMVSESFLLFKIAPTQYSNVFLIDLHRQESNWTSFFNFKDYPKNFIQGSKERVGCFPTKTIMFTQL